MITTIDNNQRVFWIKSGAWAVRNYFCNMADIEKCVKDMPTGEPYTVYHFWDNKPKKISRKTLKTFLQANQLNDNWVK
jgi:hypothetical protein